MARARLSALEIAREQVGPTFRPSTEFALSGVNAAAYFAALRKFGGSPALTTAELRNAPEAAREAADHVLVRALGASMSAEPSPVGGPGRLSSESPVAVVTVAAAASSCCRPALQASPSSRCPRLALFSRRWMGPRVQTRRFGDRYSVSLPPPAGHPRIATLTTRRGRAPDPWHLRLVTSARTMICSAS